MMNSWNLKIKLHEAKTTTDENLDEASKMENSMLLSKLLFRDFHPHLPLMW